MIEKRKVVVTITSGSFEDRSILAHLFSDRMDNFAIANEFTRKGLTPHYGLLNDQLDKMALEVSVRIAVERED